MAFDYTEGVMYGVGGVRNVSGNTTLYMLDIKTGAAMPSDSWRMLS